MLAIAATAIFSAALAYWGAKINMEARVAELERAIAASESRIAALEHPRLKVAPVIVQGLEEYAIPEPSIQLPIARGVDDPQKLPRAPGVGKLLGAN
jgi:hypothetical protein